MSESQNVEWKQSWHDDYLKWICGFANAEGGRIYIGKDDNGKVVHLANFKDLMDSIPNKIRQRLGIICHVNLQEEAGAKFIEIIVPAYEIAVSLRGRYYFHSGSTKLELTGASLSEFLLKKGGKSWDDVEEPLASLSDIDEESLGIYLEDAKNSGRLPDIVGLEISDVLEKLRLSVDGRLKRAALVLFGKDPGRFYPNIAVKIGRFGVSDTDLRFQEVIGGNLIRLLYGTIETLGNKFLVRKIDFQGIYRVEKGEYPVVALREMLLNALIHRTFMGSMVQIRVYENELTIWNEGILPYGLTIDNLRTVHNSRPRNPIIADVCFKAGYIDAWGRGTLKIIEACSEAGLPDPEIVEMDGGLLFRLRKTISGRDRSTINSAMSGAIRGVIGGVIKELSDRQLEVLAFVYEDARITYKSLAEKLGIQESTIGTHISHLKEKGVLERIGGTRGYWKLHNPGKSANQNGKK